MSERSPLELPAWAVVSDRRRQHIARVTELLDQWADAMRLDHDERRVWHDAGRWHDALRDADEATLRELVPDAAMPLPMLHGPAAAARLRAEGERREPLLHAIAHHTTGSADFTRAGRALYMADFLEPGRSFAQADRAFLARHVAEDFDGVFRQVVRSRIEWTLREGRSMYPETVALWNQLR